MVQAHVDLRQDRVVRPEFRKASVVSTFTCPRCWARNEGIGCSECGWTPDTSVACCEAEVWEEAPIPRCR